MLKWSVKNNKDQPHSEENNYKVIIKQRTSDRNEFCNTKPLKDSIHCQNSNSKNCFSNDFNANAKPRNKKLQSEDHIFHSAFWDGKLLDRVPVISEDLHEESMKDFHHNAEITTNCELINDVTTEPPKTPDESSGKKKLATWDEISLFQTDDESRSEDFLLRVFSSFEDSCSSSGISTGGSDVEWKPFEGLDTTQAKVGDVKIRSLRVKIKSELEKKKLIEIESRTSIRNSRCSCEKKESQNHKVGDNMKNSHNEQLLLPTGEEFPIGKASKEMQRNGAKVIEGRHIESNTRQPSSSENKKKSNAIASKEPSNHSKEDEAEKEIKRHESHRQMRKPFREGRRIISRKRVQNKLCKMKDKVKIDEIAKKVTRNRASKVKKLSLEERGGSNGACGTNLPLKDNEADAKRNKHAIFAKIMPTGRKDKSPKRQSHFFTEDYSTNLPYTKSWLDENIFPNLRENKLGQLFRSRSFSHPKDEAFVVFGNGPTADDYSEAPEKTQIKQAWDKISRLKGFSKSLPKPRNKRSRPSIMETFYPQKRTQSMGIDAVLNLAADGRDYLMWCPDEEFDNVVSSLDMRGLVELVQTLQDAMVVEQQTFESLSLQLEHIENPYLQQRLSAALCTSQTRLARLCSRNMRCFAQQAMKSRQKNPSNGGLFHSRCSSPRDSGLAVSSCTGGSDFETDFRDSSVVSSPDTLPSPFRATSFSSSLNFFQKASEVVPHSNIHDKREWHNTRMPNSTPIRGQLKKDWRMARSSGGPEGSRFPERGNYTAAKEEPFDNDFGELEDHDTYEQVLYINGKPQFKDESNIRCYSYDSMIPSKCQLRSPNSLVQSERPLRSKKNLTSERSRSCNWNRVQMEESGGTSAVASKEETAVERGTVSVAYEPSFRSLLASGDSHSRSLTDLSSSCVTLPKRKPVLNFGSVTSAVSGDSTEFYYASDFTENDFECKKRNSGGRTIVRAYSFKEGLNYKSSDSLGKVRGLSRTQSFNGLSGDFNEAQSANPRLRRVPSVDEILESVKSLRAKRIMVKSDPNLLISPERGSNSSSRHKNGKTQKASKTSTQTKHGAGIIHEYEQLRKYDNAYYENLPQNKTKEVIYDSPKKPERYYERIKDSYYENVPADPPLYENIRDSEPTYMNVSNKTKQKSTSKKNKTQSPNETQITNNTYANIEETNSKSSHKASKGNKSSKVSTNDSQTYDVPRGATHIYDVPPNKPRKVKSEHPENEYDTPKNNRIVPPKNSHSMKKEQIKKIDDIFADCERDSVDGPESGKEPNIPSPDYGSEEEELADRDLLLPKEKSTIPSEYVDEGLGESDSRSYYADEQGLEVIIEEPEEDYCSPHSSSEDIRREVNLRLNLKGEQRSLDGSEGIGSASSGSELGTEEDCTSSGIHSEDTPSPGPQDSIKKASTAALTAVPNLISDERKEKKDEERTQKDRCIEIYPETLRQRQRNMPPSPSKVDIKNWEPQSSCPEDPSMDKKYLPSVKALRHQFENGKVSSREPPATPPPPPPPPSSTLGITSTSSSSSSLTMSSIETSSGFGSMPHSQATADVPSPVEDADELVEPIYSQFKNVDQELKELMSRPQSTTSWNAQPLLKRLYFIPEAPKINAQGTTYINIEGYLEKLPSGRKKATFWNAWKRRYFSAKDGILYYYQSNQMDKPTMKLSLMGGKIEMMDPNMVSIDDGDREAKCAGMLGIDDGKGHYVVVRCSSRHEAEKWKRALDTHTIEDFTIHYVQPWPRPTNPTLLRDTLIIDLGSCSVRAGVLASQATLPQVFFPSVVATNRETRKQIWGLGAVAPDVRSVSTLTFPIRPSHKISKYSVDLTSVSSLLQRAFNDLKVDPKNYNIQLSVPRVLNPHTQAELLRILFETFGVKAVNLTHQSILALYAYNATSGIVVDIGERLDVVPVIDGYIVDGGVSRIPYGGCRILEHLRQFLFQRNVSLVNEVESYVLRSVLESICYCAQHYNTEKARCSNNSDNFEKSLPLSEYQLEGTNTEAFKNISLDFGRFQAVEGLFNPDAWGLDHPGIHKLVHKAIQECSMDIRKEMSRSIFLAGGVTQLPGLADRLATELDNLTPPAIRPKVHVSPYRYHAAYLGACVLAESAAFSQSKITKEEWMKQGNSALRKWAL